MNPEILIGFDYRSFEASPASWDTQRRSTYALREDCERILSTDENVWPSVLSHIDGWKGPVQNLWDDLERLTKQSGKATFEEGCLPVAFTLHSEYCSQEEFKEWQDGSFAAEAGKTIWHPTDRIRTDSISAVK